MKVFWEKSLQTQMHTCFKVSAQYETYTGEPRLFAWMENSIPIPEGSKEAVKNFKFLYTGIAAAAKTDGRAGDGSITVEDLASAQPITLHNHEIYQLSTGTFTPVANIGDAIIVSNYANVGERNLVIASFADQLLARRYNEAQLHPHLSILTGQAIDPYALPQPIIAPKERLVRRKVIGTIFAAHILPIPPKDYYREFLQIADLSAISKMLENAKLFKVSGRSAEPTALHDQYIITNPSPFFGSSIKSLDGQLVIATDEGGMRYFKRMHINGVMIVLESLNSDGTTSSEILSLDGALGTPKLTSLLEVIGVLFELP